MSSKKKERLGFTLSHLVLSVAALGLFIVGWIGVNVLLSSIVGYAKVDKFFVGPNIGEIVFVIIFSGMVLGGFGLVGYVCHLLRKKD